MLRPNLAVRGGYLPGDIFANTGRADAARRANVKAGELTRLQQLRQLRRSYA
jgi:hypothetical protein